MKVTLFINKLQNIRLLKINDYKNKKNCNYTKKVFYKFIFSISFVLNVFAHNPHLQSVIIIDKHCLQ